MHRKSGNGQPKEHKQFRPVQLKIDAEQGIVEEIVSVFGVIDQGNDIVHPGAFAKTIQERGTKIKVLDQHQTDSIMRILGKPIAMRELGRGELPQSLINEYPEATGGLAVTTQYFLDTPEGKGAFIRIKNGTVEYSFGYDPQDLDYSKVTINNKQETIRNLRTIKLYEYGPVLWGMNEATMTVSAKSNDDGDKDEKPAPDTTENYVRVRVLPPGDFEDGSLRTIDISKPKGIRAIAGRLKGETTTTIQSYLFDKEKWSEEEAAKWVEDHDKDVVIVVDEKSVNLTETVRQIESTFCDQFNTGDMMDYWVREVFDDHLIACHINRMEGKDEYYSVPFTFADGILKFAPVEQWTAGAYVFMPLPATTTGVTTATMSAANEEPEAKSGRVLSRRNAEALRAAVDRLVDVMKGAGVWETDADEEPDADGKGGKSTEPATDTSTEAVALQDNEQAPKEDTQAGPPVKAPTDMSAIIDIERVGLDILKLKHVEVRS